MNRVKGKVCIVTGGALGIGRACAERLGEEGAKVAVFDLLDTEGEALMSPANRVYRPRSIRLQRCSAVCMC